jgi:hypothetical protein
MVVLARVEWKNLLDLVNGYNSWKGGTKSESPDHKVITKDIDIDIFQVKDRDKDKDIDIDTIQDKDKDTIPVKVKSRRYSQTVKDT